MSLFGKKKEEIKETGACCCGGECETQETSDSCCGETVDGICCIKVLGAGCKSCEALFNNVREAATKKGLPVEVEYITDMEKVMEYGAMSMPALVINEKVVSVGKVLKPKEVEEMLG